MTLQEMIKSLDDLSPEDMTSLMEILRFKLSEGKADNQKETIKDNDTFWDMTVKFREKMEQEGIAFTDEDFANLRDKSVGREVKL